MSYGGMPATVNRDAVRLLVGDISTSTSGEFLANGDYDFFLTETPNIYIAAQLAANSLAALFMGSASASGGSGFVEKQVGDLRLKKADAMSMARSYRELAAKFGRMAASKKAPYAGGISKNDKQTVEDDSDRVVPFFTRDLMDNVNATQPFSSTGSSTSL